MEEAVVEVPEEHVGQVVDLMGQRKALMQDMSGGEKFTFGRALTKNSLCASLLSKRTTF